MYEKARRFSRYKNISAFILSSKTAIIYTRISSVVTAPGSPALARVRGSDDFIPIDEYDQRIRLAKHIALSRTKPEARTGLDDAAARVQLEGIFAHGLFWTSDIQGI